MANVSDTEREIQAIMARYHVGRETAIEIHAFEKHGGDVHPPPPNNPMPRTNDKGRP